MADPLRLHPEDRPDFESVLRLALTDADIQKALSTDPAGQASARLRLRALGDADVMAAAACEAYGTYLALRASTQPDPPRRPTAGPLLPALTVLTPLVATASAAVLLALGHLLQLTDTEGALPGSLVSAGWVLTLIAGAGALLAFTTLLRTAMRGDDESADAARLQQSRVNWQQALLDRGVLPRLRQYLHEDPAVLSTPPLAVRTIDSRGPRTATGSKEHPSPSGQPECGTSG
ncbi:hypothetical protein ACFVZC_06480 [Streptomyces marokkonensis]|uniref:Transmembrane protein n=1 Tax=Streptomyces marokkonensis TaxID=324855 RepID=A0ABW6Q1R5_9ACTN